MPGWRSTCSRSSESGPGDAPNNADRHGVLDRTGDPVVVRLPRPESRHIQSWFQGVLSSLNTAWIPGLDACWMGIANV